MKQRFWSLILVAALMSGTGLAQQPGHASGESHKYRKALTVAGIGGGFTAGVFTGLALFDDAINSDRKVWTTALIAAAGGGAGGYFLGRSIDRRRSGTSALTIPIGNKALAISPISGHGGTGMRFAMQF